MFQDGLREFLERASSTPSWPPPRAPPLRRRLWRWLPHPPQLRPPLPRPASASRVVGPRVRVRRWGRRRALQWPFASACWLEPPRPQVWASTRGPRPPPCRRRQPDSFACRGRLLGPRWYERIPDPVPPPPAPSSHVAFADARDAGRGAGQRLYGDLGAADCASAGVVREERGAGCHPSGHAACASAGDPLSGLVVPVSRRSSDSAQAGPTPCTIYGPPSCGLWCGRLCLFTPSPIRCCRPCASLSSANVNPEELERIIQAPSGMSGGRRPRPRQPRSHGWSASARHVAPPSAAWA